MVYNTPNVIKCGDFYREPGLLLTSSVLQVLLKEHRILCFWGFEADIPSLAGTSTLLLLPGQLSSDAAQLKQIFSLV